VDKAALVTGGTDGIGKEIAIGLARAGCRVLIVGRDAAKGLNAQSAIRCMTRNTNVHFLRADLGLVRDTQRLAADVTQRYESLSYLVHSAGIVNGRRELTVEGIESNFAVNYLSRFVLSTELLPLLLRSASTASQSRVLFVSGAAKNGTIYFDDVNLTKRFGTLRAVMQFCQANDLLALELAERIGALERAGVTTACLKVGVVKTGIRRTFPLWMKWVVPIVMDPLLALSPAQVAHQALRLVIDPEFEDVTGAFFQFIRRFKAIEVPATVRHPELRGRLWETSERLVIKAACA
jgi:NAD(P)-dependent dehydrogenase (short-subunit alcohol dehydrogenase family)